MIDRDRQAMNLEDYNKEILKPAVDRFARCAEQEIVTYMELKEQMEFWGPISLLTRRQKYKIFIEDKKQRCKDIWTIVTGGDVHHNCGQ